MSTNISKQKREDLLAKIKEIRSFISSAPQDENTGNLLSYISDLEKDVNGKKYGLVFEEHREEIDKILDTHTPVLTEDKDLFIDNGGQMNFLIEGDNLASLKLLEKTHKGGIDILYIDPPYNTKNKDFIYDDCKVGEDDSFRHSKWISFMAGRLRIAERLLSEKGCIFISIDDNEQANLKLLCDEILGEKSFVALIPWRKRTAKSDVPFGISQDCESILCYANPLFKAGIKGKERKYYETPDFPDRPWRFHDLTTQRTIEERPNSNYTMINPKNNEEFPVNPLRCWAITKETFQQYYDENRVIFPRDYDFLKISKPVLRYWKEDDMKKAGADFGVVAVSTYLPSDMVGMTQDGTKEITTLFGSKKFSFPKPVELIKYLIEVATLRNKNAIILDFFAGSGTTGHAVMKLNAEDGGNRKFILCTNNENNICRDVTYERIKRVIDKEGYSASLKYYKVDYVPISERMYYEYADELLYHIRELVELENGVNFMGNAEIAIVLTEEELDDFIFHLEENTQCEKVYLGHDILMDARQAQVLKDRKITINIIPDYYYKELEG